MNSNNNIIFSFEYTYDFNANRLISNGQKINHLYSHKDKGQNTPLTVYGFALDGRRVSKAGAVDLKYLYNGENVVYELWDEMTVRFVHPVKSGSCGGCSGGCAGNSGIFFTDHPVSISIDGVKYYYLYDGLGSVTELQISPNLITKLALPSPASLIFLDPSTWSLDPYFPLTLK